MVDINSIIISAKNIPPPKDYYSSFETLGAINVLPNDFAQTLASCTGMRNRPVHEYDKIDDQIVFDGIPALIGMVNEYIKYINAYLPGL
ncbi:MAG: type VII toxin-antitoxin system HepT family RNase toxin [Bacillota bacterium]